MFNTEGIEKETKTKYWEI